MSTCIPNDNVGKFVGSSCYSNPETVPDKEPAGVARVVGPPELPEDVPPPFSPPADTSMPEFSPSLLTGNSSAYLLPVKNQLIKL